MSFSAADALALLRRAHAEDRLAHAYLVTGVEGSGKRQLLSDLASMILAGTDAPLTHPDVHVLEPESKSRRIRTEAIRELERQLRMRSLRGGKKIGIVFDADRLQEQAANAFLKTLEEPPANSHLFLVSSLPDQLLETVLSRCIEVPLQATEVRLRTEIQTNLLQTLASFARHPKPTLPQIFLLVRQFEGLLAQSKQAALEENAAESKKQEALYKQFGTKQAIEEREEYFSALSESRYLGERTRLLGTLEQWWADVLRQKVCAPAESTTLDYPDFATETSQLAHRHSIPELLRKNAAAEELRSGLERNIQEQLAFEVGFLKLFEGPGRDQTRSSAA